MGFYVDILRCADGSYYTGHTDNLEARLAAHRRGEIGGYTETRRPVELVFAEEFSSRDEAFQRERQIKGWRRAKKEALIKRDWERLRQLESAHGEPVEPRVDASCLALRQAQGERFPRMKQAAWTYWLRSGTEHGRHEFMKV